MLILSSILKNRLPCEGLGLCDYIGVENDIAYATIQETRVNFRYIIV